MQELMCRHKVYGLSPRDCLKTTLFQKWQRIVAPPGELLLFLLPVHLYVVLDRFQQLQLLFLCAFVCYMTYFDF